MQFFFFYLYGPACGDGWRVAAATAVEVGPAAPRSGELKITEGGDATLILADGEGDEGGGPDVSGGGPCGGIFGYVSLGLGDMLPGG